MQITGPYFNHKANNFTQLCTLGHSVEVHVKCLIKETTVFIKHSTFIICMIRHE